MTTSNPFSLFRTLPSSAGLVALIAVLASLAMAGCGQQNNGELKSRIVDLENQAKKQEIKINMLAAVATRSRASVFDSPLRQFFDAPEFWEVVYEDEGACHNNCYTVFQGQLDACDGDSDCEDQAATDTVACHKKCGSPF